MKPYIQGLITGILLTVSAMMFMGANAMESYDSFYDMQILQVVQDIESDVSSMKRWGVDCN